MQPILVVVGLLAIASIRSLTSFRKDASLRERVIVETAFVTLAILVIQ